VAALGFAGTPVFHRGRHPGHRSERNLRFQRNRAIRPE
jgi:hypothetical protein